PGISLQSNGGNVIVLASGNVFGRSNTFVARAMGVPELAQQLGGGIEIAAGLTPETEQSILSSDRLRLYFADRDPTFIGPALSLGSEVIDTHLFGANVVVNTNQTEPGLLQRLPADPTPDSGRIDISSSSIAIDQGAVIFDALTRGSKVSLPHSAFAASAY